MLVRDLIQALPFNTETLEMPIVFQDKEIEIANVDGKVILDYKKTCHDGVCELDWS